VPQDEHGLRGQRVIARRVVRTGSTRQRYVGHAVPAWEWECDVDPDTLAVEVEGSERVDVDEPGCRHGFGDRSAPPGVGEFSCDEIGAVPETGPEIGPGLGHDCGEKHVLGGASADPLVKDTRSRQLTRSAVGDSADGEGGRGDIHPDLFAAFLQQRLQRTHARNTMTARTAGPRLRHSGPPNMRVDEPTLETPLGELSVVRATVDQAGSVLELRDDLARWMLEHGIEQWRPGDLPLEWIQVCAAQGWVFVMARGKDLVGSVTIVWEDPLIWGERPEPAGYVHMLMVDRDLAGHGIGRCLLGWAERFILGSEREVARLDCARANGPLRSYYERDGYRLVEYQDFPGVERALETALYEKSLRP
jgi:GNAT superfamily N-acetyltransferase